MKPVLRLSQLTALAGLIAAPIHGPAAASSLAQTEDTLWPVLVRSGGAVP